MSFHPDSVTSSSHNVRRKKREPRIDLLNEHNYLAVTEKVRGKVEFVMPLFVITAY